MTENLAPDKETRYETKDIRLRPFAIFVLGFIASLAAIYLILFLFMRVLGDIDRVSGNIHAPSANELAHARQPELQVDPATDLRSYLAAEEQILNSYGWVDRDRGVVRIPIGRAMDLLLSRGVPVRPAIRGPTELEMQQQKAQTGPSTPAKQRGNP
jgi:hypothetical protein